MMEKIESVAQKNVFTQIGARSTSGANKSFYETIALIKSDNLARATDKLRTLKKEGKFAEAKQLKQTLPAVTFAATYKDNRISGNESEYNELCVIDIDDLQAADHQRCREQLQNDDRIVAVWTSPSGNGIKGLVSFDFGMSPPMEKLNLFHRAGFLCIQGYLRDRYNIELDASGKDVTRLCFLSYDPDICIKSEFKKIAINYDIIRAEEELIDKSKRAVMAKEPENNGPPPKNWMNPANRNKSADRTKMQSIIKYLRKRALSVTFQYDQWYHVAFAIANTFTFDIGLRYFLELSKLDREKYDPSLCRRMLEYAFVHSKGQITIGTVIYYAQNLGFEI
jgi:hypothetical protein